MRMLDKIIIGLGPETHRPWQFSVELGHRLSKNAAYIRALKPPKPLVSLV